MVMGREKLTHGGPLTEALDTDIGSWDPMMGVDN